MLGTLYEIQAPRPPDVGRYRHLWGREHNTFYRRAKQGLEQHGTKELNAKDTTPLGAAVIHSVTNPLDQITAAIHVYGGDFFATPRSEWDPESFEERPYDIEDTIRAFEEANERLRDKAPHRGGQS